MSTGKITPKLWFEKLHGSDNYRPWSKNMISTFETENLDEVVFEKVAKPEKPTTQKRLDELEYREMLKNKLEENESLPDREEIKILFAHYKNEWKRYEDWIQMDRKAKTLIRLYSDPKLHSSLLDSHNSAQYWKSLEQNYQNPTVAPMFDLYKKFSTKHVNPQKNMSQQTAEIQHLMQCMADLANITPDLLEALGILRFLNTDSSYSQLVQQIKSMKLKEFNAASITHLVNGVERPKTTVAAVAGVKRKANFSNGQFAKRRCLECNKSGHDESNCWFKHPEKRPQNYPQNNRRNLPLQARVTHAAEKSQKHQRQQEDDQSDD